MKKSELQQLRAVAGDLSGLYGMQDFTYNEGRAKGLRAIELKNGKGLCATLLADRALDIPYFSYKGTNLGLVLKPGLAAPTYYVQDGTRGFLKQFNGGLLTTCGLMYSGAPGSFEGREHGLHGSVHDLPAYNVNKEEVVVDDAITLRVSGSMREACVFSEWVELHRRVELETERNWLHVWDTIENRGFEPAPLVMLYHFNFGYPFIDDGTKIYCSTPNVEPRDEVAEKAFAKYSYIEKPEVGRPEECYIHTGGVGAQFGLLHNEKLGLGIAIHFDVDDLPLFNEWKCMMAGDYALGMEPSASGFWGNQYAKDHGLLRTLPSGQSKTYHIAIELLEDESAIAAYAAKCKEHK